MIIVVSDDAFHPSLKKF